MHLSLYLLDRVRIPYVLSLAPLLWIIRLAFNNKPATRRRCDDIQKQIMTSQKQFKDLDDLSKIEISVLL